MPIFYNFHIFLATFYSIFGTKILNQCPVPVPVCCMFLVSQNIHIKRSPNGIKTDGAYFWKIWKIWKENQREPVPEVVMRQGGAPPLRARPYPREPTVRRLTLFFCRKKANIRKKITAKVSGQSELRISIYTRNGETEPGENAETERDRETDPISEGLSPLPCHGGQGPEGKPFSHLGRRSRKKKKGAPLPLAFGGAGVPPGAIIIAAIFTNNFTAINTNA